MSAHITRDVAAKVLKVVDAGLSSGLVNATVAEPTLPIGTRVRISMGIHGDHEVDGTVVGPSQIADTEPRVSVRWDGDDQVTCPRVARLEIIGDE